MKPNSLIALGKSVTQSSLISGFGSLASLVLTMMFARLANTGPLGEYFLWMTWATIITVFVSFASDVVFSRLATTQADVQSSVDTVFTIRIIALCFFGGIFLLAKVVGLIEVSWLVFIFVIPVFNLGMLFEFYRCNIDFAVIILAEKTALLAANFLLIPEIGFELSVYISYASVALASMAWQALRYSGHVRAFRFVKAFQVKKYVSLYWPLLLISFSQIGYGHISRLIIEGKQGVVVLASVSIAFQFLAIVSIVQTQVDRHFRPIIMEVVGGHGSTGIRYIFMQYFLVATLPMAVLAIILFIGGPSIVELLYGEKFAPAGQVLREVSPMSVSISLLRLSEMVLLALGRVKESLVISLGCAVIMLVALQSIPHTVPLALFLSTLVGAQYVQAALAGVFAFRKLGCRVR